MLIIADTSITALMSIIIMPIFPVHSQKSNGQTMTEYTFIAFLVLIVAVSFMVLIGNGMNSSLVNLKADFTTQIAGAQNAEQQMNARAEKVRAQAEASDALSLTCDPLIKNRCVVHTSPPAAAGTNGMEDFQTAWDYLMMLFRKLGILPPRDSEAVLKELAKKGHQAAFLEQLLEQVSVYADKKPKKIKNITIMISGEPYTIQEISKLLDKLAADINTRTEEVTYSNLPSDVKEEVTQNAQTIQQNASSTSSETQQRIEEAEKPAGSNTPAAPTGATQSPQADATTAPTPARSDETREAANTICSRSDRDSPTPPLECTVPPSPSNTATDNEPGYPAAIPI